MLEHIKLYMSRYIIIISFLILGSIVFSEKEGYHMDEVLSFQLANAQYNPWIVPTQPQGRLAKFYAEHIQGENMVNEISHVIDIVKDTLVNGKEGILLQYKADIYDAPIWIERKTFIDYVQVDNKDDYNLASVYFNVKDDNHPPLHFMVLHLISSIAKGEINVWYGGIINLFCMAVTLWFLGRIGDYLFKSKVTVLSGMILFGGSTGIIATSLLIRMYAMLTMFIVMNLYFHLQAIQDDKFMRLDKKKIKHKWIGNQGIFITTLLAFWTQYFSLFFILPLAAITTFILYKNKKIKEVISYIRTMILAGLVGVLVYPFSIIDVLYSGRGKEALAQWDNGFIEYCKRVESFFSILVNNVSVNIFIFFMITICFGIIVIRNKEKIDILVWVCAIPTISYFLLASKMSPYFIDRYIMAIFPLVSIGLAGMIGYILEILFYKEEKKTYFAIFSIGIVVLICFYGWIVNKGEHPYLYKGYDNQLQVAEEYQAYPLVCLYEGYGFYENVPEMLHYESTMLVKPVELELMDEERTDRTKEGYVLLVKYPNLEQIHITLQEVMFIFGGSEVREIYSAAHSPHGDVVYYIK